MSWLKAALILASSSILIIQLKCQSFSDCHTRSRDCHNPPNSESLTISATRPTKYPPSTIEYCDPEPEGPNDIQVDPVAFLQRSPLKALLSGKKNKEKDSGKEKRDKKKDNYRSPSATGTIDPKLQRLIVDATLVGVVAGISAAIG